MEAWWVLIPLAGICAGMFKEWLKFRSTQQKLGDSTRGLEKQVSGLKGEKDALLERIENLEAIVASQTWDALHDRNLTPPERELRVASHARRELEAQAAETINQQRVEQLARRLQG